MRQLLCEGFRGSVPLIVDRTKITESELGGVTYTHIPGLLSICNIINGNKRRYRRNVWEKNLHAESSLMQSIAERSAFGLMEHPADGQISLESPICILTTEAAFNPANPDEVIGAIDILNTPDGNKLRGLVEAGYNPRVSSRGFGSLIKAPDAVDDVDEDYVCEGWDSVLKPSFVRAILNVPRMGDRKESMEIFLPIREKFDLPILNYFGKAYPVAEKLGFKSVQELWDANPKISVKQLVSVLESADPNTEPTPAAPESTAKTVALPENPLNAEDTPAENADLPSKESQQKTEESKPLTKPTLENRNNMNPKEIKSMVESIKSRKASLKTPAALAEAMSSLAGLHQSVAEYQAEDAKRSWEATQLHDEISAAEKELTELAETPVRESAQLRTAQKKILGVTKTVVETCVSLRTALAKSEKRNDSLKGLVEELTVRGRKWMEKAKSTKTVTESHEYKVQARALEIMAERYKGDVTALGKKLLVLEFAEKAKDPKFSKMLDEAEVPADIARIRGLMEGKKPVTKKPAVNEDDAPEGDAPKGDEKPEEGKGDEPAPAPENKTSSTVEGIQVIRSDRNPKVMSEAVDMVQRMSAASTKAVSLEG